MVQALLDRGASPNIADSDGWTTLTAASLEGHLHVVRALIAGGARVNAVDADGNTALMTAAFKGHDDVVEALLAAGARSSLADKQGRVARDWAREGSREHSSADAKRRYKRILDAISIS